MTNQDRQARQILADLELISHGTITAYNSSGGHGNSARVIPPGEAFPPHLEYRRRYAECETDEQRDQVIKDAQSELEAIRRRPLLAPAGLSDAEVLEARVLELTGWVANEIARSLHCTVGQVRRIRTNAGRDGQTGEVLDLSAADRSDLAARMKSEQRLSQSEIAKRMGISEATVSRLLRTRKVAA